VVGAKTLRWCWRDEWRGEMIGLGNDFGQSSQAATGWMRLERGSVSRSPCKLNDASIDLIASSLAKLLRVADPRSGFASTEFTSWNGKLI